MKRLALISAVLISTLAANAQDDAQKAAAEAAQIFSSAPEQTAPAPKPKYWTTSSQFTLGFNQTGLWNWAAGGYKTLSFIGGLDAKADYARNLASWKNRLQIQYGFFWSEDKENVLQKNNDRIYLESKFGFNTFKDSKWSYTASYDFRTQISRGYKSYDNDGGVDPLSDFFAPAYTNIALGLEWKPNNWFDLNMAPLTGGVVICSDNEFRANYGMPVHDDGSYSSALFQFGAQVKANARFIFNDVVNLETQLVLFTDYLDHPFNWTRINWDNKVSWTLSKLINLGFSTWLIYDPIVTINDKTSLTQFKEFFTLNFTYTIKGK